MRNTEGEKVDWTGLQEAFNGLDYSMAAFGCWMSSWFAENGISGVYASDGVLPIGPMVRGEVRPDDANRFIRDVIEHGVDAAVDKYNKEAERLNKHYKSHPGGKQVGILKKVEPSGN